MWLVLSTVVLFLHSVYTGLTVNKCCPLGSYMTRDFNCTVPDETSTDDLYWFPVDALYNASNQQPVSVEQQDEVLNWLRRPGVVKHKGFEICSGYEFSAFAKDLAEYYRIVVGREKKLELLTTVPEVDGGAIDLEESWMLPIEEGCLDLIPGRSNVHVLIYCPGSSKPWIHKCCPLGKMYNATSEACTDIPLRLNITDWRPHNASGLLSDHFLKAPKGPKFPVCEKDVNHQLLKSPDNAYRCRGFIKPDMKVDFLASGAAKVGEAVLHPDVYCGDRSWHPGGQIFSHNIIYCPAPTGLPATKVVYGVLFLAGGVCLLLTVAISCYLPELRRRIHNKIAITHNMTLMAAHFLWGSSQFAPDLGIAMCSIMCLLIQFTFLGSLFWLNAMCINMSSTFRTTQTLSGQSMKSEARRYAIYSLYAWGLTGLVTIFTVSMEFTEMPPYGLPRPGFSCYCDFPRHTSSVFVYFYAPMAMVLLLNLVLYVFTTWKIISVQRQTSILHHTDSKASGGASFQNDKQRLILYTKLFLLMGLTWVTEIIGWAAGAADGSFWIVLDIINLLRAVFIFVLFVCKKPVLKSLKTRLELTIGRQPMRSGSCTRSTTDAISLSTLGPSRRPSQNEEGGRKKSRTEPGWNEKRGSKQFKEESAKMTTVVSESDDEGENSEMIKTNGRISFDLK